MNDDTIYDVPYAWRVRFEGAMTVPIPDEDPACKYVLDLLDNLCNFGNELSVSAKAESCYCYHVNDDGSVEESIMKDEFMTATEANKKTKEFVNKITSKELENIQVSILSAIKEGEYQCYIGGISAKAKEILEARGFKVTIGSTYNETYTTIDWSNTQNNSKGTNK